MRKERWRSIVNRIYTKVNVTHTAALQSTHMYLSRFLACDTLDLSCMYVVHKSLYVLESGPCELVSRLHVWYGENHSHHPQTTSSRPDNMAVVSSNLLISTALNITHVVFLQPTASLKNSIAKEHRAPNSAFRVYSVAPICDSTHQYRIISVIETLRF